jgi:hypothetical protein
MAIVNLPFNPELFRSADDYEITQNAQTLVDGYVNALGSIVKRDGLSIEVELSDSITIPSSITLDGTEIDGLYWMEEAEAVVLVRYGNTYLVTLDGGDLITTNITTAALAPSVPVVFASTSLYASFTLNSVAYAGDYDILIMANGGRIMTAFRRTLSRTISDFFTIELEDVDAPTAVTHVDFIDGYLLANSVGTNTFYWSEVNDPFTWTAGTLNSTSGYASAEFDTDNIVALKVFKKEIFLFGSRSTEIWYNDGETPFVRNNDGVLSVGCIAPYSVIVSENYIYWLSNKKKLVRSNGSGVEIIPTPFDREIQEFDVVSDCSLVIMTISGRDYIKLSFPSEIRTFVVSFQDESFKDAMWSEWGNWNSANGSYDNFMGKYFAYSSLWNKHFFSGVATNDYGTVVACLLEMSREYVDDAGDLIRFQFRTGQINHGTLAAKRNKRLLISVKRGTATLDRSNWPNLDTRPQLVIRWKDDNRNSWSTEKSVSLGNIGDTMSTLDIYIGGIYVSRQWEFVMSDSVSFSIAKIQEDVEILESIG